MPLGDLKSTAIDVRFNCGNIENGDGHLGIRGLTAELVISIPESLSHSVHTNQGASREEILSLEAASAHRVLLCPDAIGIFREEFAGGELVAGVASRGGFGVSKVSGTGRSLNRFGHILYPHLTRAAGHSYVSGRDGSVRCGGKDWGYGSGSLKRLLSVFK
jgi:hypothetical protein